MTNTNRQKIIKTKKLDFNTYQECKKKKVKDKRENKRHEWITNTIDL
ncbi:hypothetical protein A71_237 [Escherichia phage A7_1]|nr:hypothetical protein A71_237 [Escherichia phage A7_1]